MSKRILIYTHFINEPLFEGSHEEYELHYCGGIDPTMMRRRIAAKEACDDLTPREQTYLAAMKRTLEQHDAVEDAAWAFPVEGDSQ